ncbi:hypothetical protein [Pseudoalteromonas tunicata]|jgi:PAS domain-containing protein|uniref:PAS domain-containing protein n=1 Tax=Pseudoalteromonas tunicata D2 TaxID=87626 RepID=A4C9C6_9GAMM|nr:hypothetical protein [Pseudoalteromonas tunicata]ATC93695.1 hypothetical protein PTUN_a0994 [Pseudoalteromonas tunicata]AXT29523.1 hypothetical protein D1819_00895 [Pseudoalteromonas tunicata]EAR29191.1 hypothetical protein PTD2_09104 [Pseudoalteromonas tunicata D2]MDP4983557.1 hypothetical protein [Pseudoalteromonas tunicata]
MLNIKPGGYFKIVIFLIGFLGGLSLFSNWYFEYRASNLLFQNLEEVHRSQKAGYEYLELKRDIGRLIIASNLQQESEVQYLRDSIRLKLRSLRKELNLWRYAIEADLSLAPDNMKEAEQDELNELLLLSQLVIGFESNTHRLLVNIFNEQSQTPQYFEHYQLWQEGLKPLDYAFDTLVRETKAENYLEFEEFEEQIALTWYFDAVLLVSALSLSIVLALLDKKRYQKPLLRLKKFLLRVRNQQSDTLKIGQYGQIYQQIENKLNSVLVRFDNEKTQLEALVEAQQQELTQLRSDKAINAMMLDSVHEALIKTSFSGEILYFNPALTDLLNGFKVEIVRNINSVITFRYENSDLLTFDRLIKDATAHPEKSDLRVLLIDTSSGPLRVSVHIRILDSGVLFSIKDATSAHTQQAQSNLISSLYESFSQSVWLLDEHWNVLDVNSVVCRQYFVQKNELMGRRMPLIEWLLTQQSQYQQVMEHLKKHHHWQGELSELSLESQLVAVKVSIQTLLHPSHLGHYLVVVDRS